MSVVTLHPEDLLERAAAGTLRAEEQVLLNAHLAGCATCRFEHDVRLDFMAERNAPLPAHAGTLVANVLRRAKTENAIRIAASLVEQSFARDEDEPRDSERTLNLPQIDFAMLAAAGRVETRPQPIVTHDEAAPEIPSVERARARRPASVVPDSKKTRRLFAYALLAACLTLATGALAGGRVRMLAFFTQSSGASVESSPAQDQRAPAASTGNSPHGIVSGLRHHLTTADESRDESLAPAPNDPLAVALVAPAALVPATPAVVNQTPHALFHNEKRDAAEPRAIESTSSRALFTEANSARERGAFADAETHYLTLLASYGGSPEANPARAALGRLLLDRGSPQRALVLFEQYLEHGGGALHEEAMAGKARALGQLNDSVGEIRAWKSLLNQYPSSVHGDRARGRLVVLGER